MTKRPSLSLVFDPSKVWFAFAVKDSYTTAKEVFSIAWNLRWEIEDPYIFLFPMIVQHLVTLIYMSTYMFLFSSKCCPLKCMFHSEWVDKISSFQFDFFLLQILSFPFCVLQYNSKIKCVAKPSWENWFKAPPAFHCYTFDFLKNYFSIDISFFL